MWTTLWIRIKTFWSYAKAASSPRGTLVDACDVPSIVKLVHVHEKGDGVDALLSRLTRTFATFPPTEPVMQRLSLFQQALQGSGDKGEYSVITALIAAQVALCELLLKEQRARCGIDSDTHNPII